MTASGHLVCAKIHGRLREAGLLWLCVFFFVRARKKWSLSRPGVLNRKVLTDSMRRSHEHCRKSSTLPLYPQSDTL